MTGTTLFAATLACGGDDGSSPEPVDYFATSYELVSVNGQAVPVAVDILVHEGAPPIWRWKEITSGSIVFGTAASFEVEMATKVSIDGAAPVLGSAGWTGTYAQTGNVVTLTFTQPTGPPVTGTLSVSGGDRTIRLAFGTAYGTLVFRESP